MRLRDKPLMLVLMLILVLTFVSSPVASSQTTLFVDPSTITVAVGEAFKIGIIIENVIDLYSFEFKLGYNTTILNVTDVWLMWPDGYVINETAGFVWANAMSPYPYAFSGNGTLATITFIVTALGSGVLDLYDTVLLDFDDLLIAHDVVDGYVSVTATHDVAVISVTPFKTEAYSTWIVPLNITVVVENQDTALETFNVTVYAYNATYGITYDIGTQTVTDLAPGANMTLPPFSWILTDVTHHVVYTIIANASVVSGETDTADNTLIDGTVFIKIPGDANGDGTVNVSDLGRLGLAWGSSFGDPNYDPRCDFNGDGTINVSDLGIMGLWWGYTA